MTNECDKMILKLLFFLFYFNLFEARVVNICEELGLENIVSDTIEKNDNNFVCFNTSDKTVFTLNILPNSKVQKTVKNKFPCNFSSLI